MEVNLDRRAKVLAVFAVLVLSITVATYALDEHSLNYQEQSFDSNVTVLNETEEENTSLGLDIGQKLNYGKLPQRTNATKFIDINSTNKAIVNIDSSGNISNNLHYERHYFEGYNRIGLEYRAKQPGNYTGDVHLEIVTSDNRFGDYWIRFRGDYWPFSHMAENARDRLDVLLYRLGI